MVQSDSQAVSSNPKPTKDYVTPHKISLLLLIKEFCCVKDDCRKRRFIFSNNHEEIISWHHTNEQNRMFASTMLKLIQSPDMDLKQLMSTLYPVLHPQTYQLFIRRLQMLRKEGIASIMDYISGMESLLTDPAPVQPIIHKSSVLGLFIRHMLLAYDKLSFSLTTKLLRSFHSYIDSTFSDHSEASVNASDCPPEDSEECGVFASQKQAEFFIAQQAALLQINESAALSPPELQQKIRELLKGNPELYEACYLSYLNCVRTKELSGARDNLHRHFDHSTCVPHDSSSTNNNKSSTAVPEDTSRSSRYAALSLAIFHAVFGHKEEALAALNEAIMVAQEVNDNTCLQFALAWLYRLTSENKEVLIERSIVKSTELGLWCLSSLGFQALTKLKSFTTTAPHVVFELITRSDFQNCQHSMADIMGPAYSLRAGLWAFYGYTSMSRLCSQILLFLNTADAVRGGVYHIGEGFCLSLRNTALDFAAEGHFAECSLVLGLAQRLFPPHSEHSPIWQLAELFVKFDRCLRQGRWQRALDLASGIAMFDEEEARLRKAQVMFHQGHMSQACSVLTSILDKYDSNREEVSPHFYTRAMLQKCELMLRTPGKESALPLLMKCLDSARSHNLLLLEALSTLQLSALQVEMGLHSLSLVTIEKTVLPLITYGSCYDRGCCYEMYSKCSALVAVQCNDTKECKVETKKELLDSIALSNKAFELFKKVKALLKMKEVLTWQAYLYNYLKMNSERNDVAYRCRNIEDEI